MSEEQRIETFEQFWPIYVRAHAKKSTRMLHFAGTSLAMACVGGAVLFRKPKLLLLAPVLGYGPAWIGHFFLEGNKPASFEHPLWSFRADLVMWKKTIDGTMDAEVERILADESGAAPREAASTPAATESETPVNGARVDVGVN